MANAINFVGANVRYKAPKDDEDRVNDLMVMKTDHFITSCWEIGPAEMNEIIRSGKVYLTVMSQTQCPAFVGGELSTRAITADYGKSLPKQTAQKAPS